MVVYTNTHIGIISRVSVLRGHWNENILCLFQARTEVVLYISQAHSQCAIYWLFSWYNNLLLYMILYKNNFYVTMLII